MASWAVPVEGWFGSYRWFVFITTLLLREASWLLYCTVGHQNPVSAPSIFLVLLEPHLIYRNVEFYCMSAVSNHVLGPYALQNCNKKQKISGKIADTEYTVKSLVFIIFQSSMDSARACMYMYRYACMTIDHMFILNLP